MLTIAVLCVASYNVHFVFYTLGDTQLRSRRKWRDVVLGVCHRRRGNDKKLESTRIKLQTVTLQGQNKLFILHIFLFARGRDAQSYSSFSFQTILRILLLKILYS